MKLARCVVANESEVEIKATIQNADIQKVMNQSLIVEEFVCHKFLKLCF